jgi:hypothetical protein
VLGGFNFSNALAGERLLKSLAVQGAAIRAIANFGAGLVITPRIVRTKCRFRATFGASSIRFVDWTS